MKRPEITQASSHMQWHLNPSVYPSTCQISQEVVLSPDWHSKKCKSEGPQWCIQTYKCIKNTLKQVPEDVSLDEM